MIWSTDPSKKVFKRIHDKAIQSYLLWLTLNKINEISILQSADKQGDPTFHFHAPGSKRRYSIFPVCSSFGLVIASDMHLESESEKRAKNVDSHTATNIQVQATLFRHFIRPILIN